MQSRVCPGADVRTDPLLAGESALSSETELQASAPAYGLMPALMSVTSLAGSWIANIRTAEKIAKMQKFKKCKSKHGNFCNSARAVVRTPSSVKPGSTGMCIARHDSCRLNREACNFEIRGNCAFSVLDSRPIQLCSALVSRRNAYPDLPCRATSSRRRIHTRPLETGSCCRIRLSPIDCDFFCVDTRDR